jgi:hypothetical protein
MLPESVLSKWIVRKLVGLGAVCGTGMLVEMMVGEQGGRVVHAGSTEWCVGLQEGREEPLTVRRAGRSS